MNKMYNTINYIYWKKEATKKVISLEDMKALIKDFQQNRTKALSNTKRSDFTETTYKLDKKGDYYSMYFLKDGKYYIYSTNFVDTKKNTQDNTRTDRLFDMKFREYNSVSLRVAYGFVDKEFKRNIPRQFYYLNEKYRDKEVLASITDASSQYPSGCYGKLPDSHTMIRLKGRIAPTEEYSFAFYKSGHLAEYGVFDTHNWLDSKFMLNLFRFDKNEDYPLIKLSDDEEETVLMKASQYTMNKTWDYYYNIKTNLKGTDEYNDAKLVMNKTIGLWHRKDANKKHLFTYDDHGSYQMAHIVAIAIARGNQKILNKIKEIGEIRILHIAVDGIIYLGDDRQGIPESKIGQFKQTDDDLGLNMMIRDYNAYIGLKFGLCRVFKHGGYDLLGGKPIDDTGQILASLTFDDLYRLSCTQKIKEIIENE